MNYQRGNLNFDWNLPSKKITNLKLNNADFDTEFAKQILKIDKNQGHPYSLKRRFFLPKEIEDSLNEFFNAIKEIKTKDKDDVLAAYLATYIFNRLAGFWENQLLKNGSYITGVTFWQEILSTALEWESNNPPVTIHKGTPFFFVAYNFLLNGDRDNGFTYLYNALEDDKKLPQLNYPKDAPAYLTAIMSEKPRNFMFPQVRDLRLFLGSFLSKYNKIFTKLTIGDFDTKFLENTDLFDIALIFVYNFKFVYDQSKNASPTLLQNDFSRLKIINLFFNFGLIIHEILRYSESGHRNTPKMMKESVSWWAETKCGVNQNTFNNLISPSGLNLNQSTLDQLIPTLLSNIQNPTNNIPKEVYIMMIAYKLRNHGAHNLNQQTILDTKYNEILTNLFYALFLAIQSI